MNQDIKFMKLALQQAKKAAIIGEVPVGAVIVKDNIVIAKAYNLRQKKKSVLGHAEILAIEKASKKLNSWILEDCTIYVTVEPCIMCTGTIIQSRIKRVVYGTNEPKFGALGSIVDISQISDFNHHIEVTKGILQDECSLMMKTFFKNLRESKIK